MKWQNRALHSRIGVVDLGAKRSRISVPENFDVVL